MKYINKLNISMRNGICQAIVTLLVLSTGSSVTAETMSGVTIKLQPGKCVSLRQGQTCYADVRLEWQADNAADYCLYNNLQTEPLQCWQQQRGGRFEREVASDKNVVFTVQLSGNQQALASAELKMAWVYKARRTATSWRVF